MLILSEIESDVIVCILLHRFIFKIDNCSNLLVAGVAKVTENDIVLITKRIVRQTYQSCLFSNLHK